MYKYALNLQQQIGSKLGRVSGDAAYGDFSITDKIAARFYLRKEHPSFKDFVRVGWNGIQFQYKDGYDVVCKKMKKEVATLRGYKILKEMFGEYFTGKPPNMLTEFIEGLEKKYKNAA